MTLGELSDDYAAAAELVRTRLAVLRSQLRRERDPARRLALRRRIHALEPMLTEMNALKKLTAHYYDRGYPRDENYTL